jgi:xanthine phosphoribosyltransferase
MGEATNELTTASLSWDSVTAAAAVLSDRLASDGRAWRGIVAVARGGLVPAAFLSRSLSLRRVETACLRSYEGSSRSEPEVLSLPSLSDGGAGWLVADDLADSGRSAAFLRGVFPNAFFCALYAKPDGAQFLDAFAELRPSSEWLIFPWESSSS